MKIGDKFSLGSYEITFKGVQRQTNSNYISDVAILSVNTEAKNFDLKPERRFYLSQEAMTSEVAIKKYITQDIYAVLGEFRKIESTNETYWVLRIYIKPFISLIWLGAIFLASGGILSMFYKKRNFQ